MSYDTIFHGYDTLESVVSSHSSVILGSIVLEYPKRTFQDVITIIFWAARLKGVIWYLKICNKYK